MTLQYQAAVLHQARTPLAVERVNAAPLAAGDVLVRVRAAGLCHTDLEVIDGSLRYPMPIVLGHEAAGVVEEIGPAVSKVRKGDHVILSWNPHCGPLLLLRPRSAYPMPGLPRQRSPRRAVRRHEQGAPRR